MTDEQNLHSSKASGSEVFDHNTETRNRQRQPSVQAQPTVNDQMIFTSYRRILSLFAILIPVILVFYNYLPLNILDIPDIPRVSQFPIDAPTILLIGKTGAGKSTLGNLLLGTYEDKNPTFNFSNGFSAVTNESAFANIRIGNKIYNIVDTPGIFDTDKLNEVILKEIARTIQKCAYGIKAILFVIEAGRFTKEQKEMVNMIKLFLGDESLQYMISVFSRCNRKQTEDPEYFREISWNQPIRSLVNSMGNRWAISPNPDIYPPGDLVRKQHLEELKNHIISTNGIYTNEILEKAREEQEENARIAREAEEKRRREYDESKKREGIAIAKANYERQRAEDEKKANEKHKAQLQYLVEKIENERKAEKEKHKEELQSLLKRLDDLNNRANYERERAEDERKANEKHKEQLQSLLEKIEDLKDKIASVSASTKTVTSSSSGSSGGCFGLETQVKLESGRIIQMSELQTGDRVLSNIRNGISEYSEVYLIAHIGKLDHEEEFAKVNFTRPDGSKGQLRLTTTHYVFDENLSIMFSKDLRPGETKILVSDDNNKLVPVFVDDVTIELHDKYISFYTRAGSVIANGVLCSCYDQCPSSQTFMDLVFLPIRWWTYIIPSTHREERLHPYVQFLETVYLLFTNFMGNNKRLIEN